MDVRDKLLFETEYAGNVKEKIPPKSSLRIPWRWLPAALCLLQEVHYILCIFYCFFFLWLCAAGAGPWSLDRLLKWRGSPA